MCGDLLDERVVFLAQKNENFDNQGNLDLFYILVKLSDNVENIFGHEFHFGLVVLVLPGHREEPEEVADQTPSLVGGQVALVVSIVA